MNKHDVFINNPFLNRTVHAICIFLHNRILYFSNSINITIFLNVLSDIGVVLNDYSLQFFFFIVIIFWQLISKQNIAVAIYIFIEKKEG